MADVETLTLAYVTSHPADAARVLEQRAPNEAGALFTRLPARAGAPALAAMLPNAAARVITAVSHRVALGLLTAAGAQASVAILRHLPETRRARLIEGLPTATAIAARLLLGYPEDAVGAWADPQVVALAPTLSAQDAFDRVRGEPEGEAEDVYIVGEDQRLLGVVDLATLVRAPDWRSLEGLMQPPVATLSALMPLGAAAAHPAWAQANELPVVARGERLIGVLRLSVLKQALGKAGARDDVEELSLAGFAAQGYWDAVSGLVRAFIALMPRAAPVARKGP
jgi:Mg/Co/Ni transporter MgtE